MPVEAAPAASECEGQVPAFLAVGQAALTGMCSPSPHVCRAGESQCGVEPVCMTRINGMKLGEGESGQEMFPQGESY